MAQLDRVLNEGDQSKLDKLRAEPVPACAAQPGRQSSTAPAGDSRHPAPPDRIEVAAAPAAGKAPAVQTLAALLDRATVLIIQGHFSGSGFFISPTRVLTNRHVVGNATSVEVGNRTIGRLVPARVAALGSASGVGRQDIALLDVPPQSGTEALRIGVTPERLAGVTAAGFPGILLASDAERARLPEATFTQGAVGSRQAHKPDGIETIFHTATIAGGNSGGPLVDGGGCVVGMNSWGTADVDDGVTLANYSEAIDASELRRFLSAEGVAFTAADAPCTPIRTLDPSADAASR